MGLIRLILPSLLRYGLALAAGAGLFFAVTSYIGKSERQEIQLEIINEEEEREDEIRRAVRTAPRDLNESLDWLQSR